MKIHPIKRISSIEGLGVNTTKSMEFLDDNLGIGVEKWNDLEEPWKEGETIIAEPGYTWRTKWETGKPYIINKFYDTTNKLVAVYCDICRPVERIEGGFAFDDLYLDIWQIPSEPPVILDEDELELNITAGNISQTEAAWAREQAAALITKLAQDPNFLDF